MSHASRHFQMLGSLHANRRVVHVPAPLYNHKNLRRVYDTARIGPNLYSYQKELIKNVKKMTIGFKPVGILNAQRPVSPYRVGEVYRPKRANQHSRNLIVTACTSSHVSYSRGGAETNVTHDAFAALIGRKVS